jgi:ADP-ribose pyrophosphatase
MAMLSRPEFLLHQRQEIYKGRIVSLVVDSITTSNGVDTIREVFKHPGGAAVVPLLPDGTVLLVRQYRYPMGEYLLELPAGKIDQPEPPEQTAARELAEETGYQAGCLEKIAEIYSTPGFCDELLHIYLATELSPVQAHQDEDEEIEVLKFTLSELRDLMLSGQIRDGKTLIGIQHLFLRQATIP